MLLGILGNMTGPRVVIMPMVLYKAWQLPLADEDDSIDGGPLLTFVFSKGKSSIYTT
jgi:hypothetical protein